MNQPRVDRAAVTQPGEEPVSQAGRLWQAVLRQGGYEHHIGSRRELAKLKRPSRAWKVIEQITATCPPSDVLEVGCGGGKHLVSLALRGYRCTGVDVSRDVLARSKNFIAETEASTRCSLSIRLEEADFLSWSSRRTFDLVFNFGVIEHFVDERERRLFMEQMMKHTTPGGHMVCVVPSGIHPLRQKMRQEGLGGYDIPEIDYSPSLLADELRSVGADEVTVLPHNYFGYLLLDKRLGMGARVVRESIYLAAQVLPRIPWLERHAMSLIGVGRRPRR